MLLQLGDALRQMVNIPNIFMPIIRLRLFFFLFFFFVRSLLLLYSFSRIGFLLSSSSFCVLFLVLPMFWIVHS